MSRIGRKPLEIPKGVQVTITNDTISTKGPKGTLALKRHKDIEIKQSKDEDGKAVKPKRASLPKGVEETHVSLFDGSNCGLAVAGQPVFSVQYHPEASPGPQDSHYLFDRFVDLMRARKGPAAVRER